MARDLKTMKMGLAVAACFLACVVCAPTAPARLAGQTSPASQSAQPPSVPGLGNRSQIPLELPDTPDSTGPTAQQKKNLLKYRFDTMKKDADKLSELATSLQKEIGKSNQNILSLDVLAKADKIEKLAKKIKENAKGY